MTIETKPPKFELFPYNTTTETCGICSDSFNGESKILAHPGDGLKHPYHEKCINRWLIMNPSCPHCRIGVEPTKHNRIRIIFDQTINNRTDLLATTISTATSILIIASKYYENSKKLMDHNYCILNPLQLYPPEIKIVAAMISISILAPLISAIGQKLSERYQYRNFAVTFWSLTPRLLEEATAVYLLSDPIVGLSKWYFFEWEEHCGMC